MQCSLSQQKCIDEGAPSLQLNSERVDQESNHTWIATNQPFVRDTHVDGVKLLKQKMGY